MTRSLRDLIAEEHRTSRDPVVDRAVFGAADPAAIESVFAAHCDRELGSPILSARFYRVSAACVAGVDLADGRSVVLKAQRGGRREDYLVACNELRATLAGAGFPCPRPLGPPRRHGPTWLTAEELQNEGAPADAHDPAIRSSIAAALAHLEEATRHFPHPERFGRAWYTAIPEGCTFPRPHSPAFDFDATREGAEWIEALAAEARARRHDATGDRAIGHFDFRAEHLRFDGGRIVASFDWDSLHHELVSIWIGALAPHFTADWQRDDIARAPSLDEMRAFVSDFERHRGRPFSPPERRTLSASSVYAMAYTARCNHASSPADEGWNGDLRPLLRDSARALLDHGL